MLSFLGIFCTRFWATSFRTLDRFTFIHTPVNIHFTMLVKDLKLAFKPHDTIRVWEARNLYHAIPLQGKASTEMLYFTIHMLKYSHLFYKDKLDSFTSCQR